MSRLLETLEERVIREAGLMWREHELWEPVWQELSLYVAPRRGDITVTNVPGALRTRRLFDSTAIIAANRLASALNGAVTPSTIQWFDFEPPSIPGVPVPKIVHDWVQGDSEAMFSLMQRTNMDAELQEAWYDLVVFGTTAIIITNDNGIPKFRTLHPAEYAIWTNSDGDVTKLVRRINMTVREAIGTFGFENLPLTVQQDIQIGGDVDQPYTVIHWIANRQDEVLGFPIDNFPVASVYVDEKHKHLLRKAGFDEWPVPVVRFALSSGESYGRCPAFDSLPDIASLNKAEEYGLRAWGMSVMPPLLSTHDGVLGRPDLRPLHMTTVSHDGALQWFPPGTKLDIETVKREDKRKAIWQSFYMDQVQYVPERGKTPPSATEVHARLNIMLQVLGPVLARIEHELLLPLLARCHGILQRAERLPSPPGAVLQYAERIGQEMSVQFLGPIARAKRQTESQKLDTILMSVAPAIQLDPNTADVIDLDEWVYEKMRVEMAPRTLLRSREAVLERREQREEMMRQQQQMAAAQQMSETVGNVAPLAREANGQRR